MIEEVHIYGELHRFVPVLAHARGFRVGEIEVHHRARRFGRSKYGVARFLKGSWTSSPSSSSPGSASARCTSSAASG